MARLLLIRHGQASFRAENYDQLSPLGHNQALHLGEYAARRAIPVHRLITGPLQRQRQTTDGVVSAYQRHNVTLPEIEHFPQFREHFGPAVMQYAFSANGMAEPALTSIREMLANEKDLSDREHNFLFRSVMREWLDGTLRVDDLETFATFRQRVAEGLFQIQEARESGQTVAVITSGGVISAAVGQVLGLDDHQVMHMSLYVRNTSITEFIMTDNQLTLLSFNELPHLEPNQVTYI